MRHAGELSSSPTCPPALRTHGVSHLRAGAGLLSERYHPPASHTDPADPLTSSIFSAASPPPLPRFASLAHLACLQETDRSRMGNHLRTRQRLMTRLVTCVVNRPILPDVVLPLPLLRIPPRPLPPPRLTKLMHSRTVSRACQSTAESFCCCYCCYTGLRMRWPPRPCSVLELLFRLFRGRRRALEKRDTRVVLETPGC